jgi:hypothetical protein
MKTAEDAEDTEELREKKAQRRPLRSPSTAGVANP